MIRTRLFHVGQRPTAVTVDEWPRLRHDDASTLWVDLEAPTDDETGQVLAVFEIGPEAAALARRPSRRPVVRTYRDHYLVTALAIDVDEKPVMPRIDVIQLDVLVGRNFLVSYHQQPIPFAAELEERTATNPDLGRLDSSYLLYVLLDTLVSHYALEFEEVEDEVERLEEELLREPGRGALDQAMRMKRHIRNVSRLVTPHLEAFSNLVAADSPIQDQRVEAYFRDLVGYLSALIERLDHARDAVTTSYTLYISNISHRTNQQLRVLTFLSAVLLPMTVITGLFGTNFKLGEYDAWEPFYVMLIGMGLITAGMLAFFRWRRWL